MNARSGAAALAGTSFPIDRVMTAKALGFARPMANSLDAVADRDFALECARGLRHHRDASVALRRGDRALVRAACRFVSCRDTFTTGSSMMPQKRNPDAAELVRAKAGRIVGALTALFVVMKGLAARLSEGHAGGQGRRDRCLRHAGAGNRGHDRHGARHRARCRAHAAGGGRGLFHRDRSGRLARAHAQAAVSRGAPRDRPHRGEAAEAGVALEKLPLARMQEIEPRITKAVFAALAVDNSVKSRAVYGGTAPKNVRAQAKRWLKRLPDKA